MYKARQSRVSGFSLIELSIALVIIGILLVGFLQAYTIYDEKQKIERMRFILSSVEQSLKNFPNLTDPSTIDPATGVGTPYGRLPCPAPMDGTIAGNDYDSESCPSPTDPTTPPVLVGKIPAATLGIHNDYMRDLYGNYFLYTVTTSAINQSGYGASAGQITVVEEGIDRNPSSPTAGQIIPLETHTNVQFVVVSMGKQGQGSYGFNGSQETACPDSTIKEHENCDGDSTFISSYRHDSKTNNYYDDSVIFVSNLLSTKIQKSPACEQTDLFSTYAPSCPDGWSETSLPTAPAGQFFLTDNSRWGAPVQNYNIDPKSGDYFFTDEVTSYTTTQGGNAPATRRTCKKNETSTAKTKCFTENIVAWSENVNDSSGRPNTDEVCPEGWVLISKKDLSCTSNDGEDNDRMDVLTHCNTTRYCGKM